MQTLLRNLILKKPLLEMGFEATKFPSTIEKSLEENDKEKLVNKLKRI